MRAARKGSNLWVAVFAAAASAFVGGPLGGPAHAQQALKFSLDGKFEAAAAPFFLALDQGLFKAEDLSVAIDPAASEAEAISRVASGAYDMGIADINAVIRFRDERPQTPVAAVFMVYNKPLFAIVGRMSRGVCKPNELEGKKLGGSPQDAAFAYWPVFARLNGIDEEKVTVMSIGAPVREPMLAAGEVDAIAGPAVASYVNLKDRGVPAEDICVLAMADHGLKLYGKAIIANAKFAADKPEAVRAFLRAFAKAIRESSRNPAAAINAALKRTDAENREIALERLQRLLRDHVFTLEVKANGLGAVDMARLAQSIDQIALAHPFKGPKPGAEDVFDSSFLPQRALRGKDG